MNKTIVAYRSKTGYTQKYARRLAEELGCDCIENPSLSTLLAYDTILYGGGLYIGKINGIGLVTKNFHSKKCTWKKSKIPRKTTKACLPCTTFRRILQTCKCWDPFYNYLLIRTLRLTDRVEGSVQTNSADGIDIDILKAVQRARFRSL